MIFPPPNPYTITFEYLQWQKSLLPLLVEHCIFLWPWLLERSSSCDLLPGTNFFLWNRWASLPAVSTNEGVTTQTQKLAGVRHQLKQKSLQLPLRERKKKSVTQGDHIYSRRGEHEKLSPRDRWAQSYGIDGEAKQEEIGGLFMVGLLEVVRRDRLT